MKSFLGAILIAVMVSGLAFVGNVYFGEAQNGTNVTGIITSDTTWTQTNSPYTISSSVTINNGVTLTMEPGVSVNIEQGAYLQVDGALIAQGTSANNIQLNGVGSLILTSHAADWNQSNMSGCIIENAKLHLNSFNICCSAKINNNTITGNLYPDGRSPQITDNKMEGAIWGNDSVQSPFIANNNVTGAISIPAGFPVITNNIVAGLYSGFTNDSSYIAPSLNVAIMTGPSSIITDNTVTSGLDGIDAGDSALVERNLIENCVRHGMEITAPVVAENNTFFNNTITIMLANFNKGISNGPSLPTVTGNNFLNSSQYNIYSYCSMDLNLTYNWWGTTNASAINQTIYDFKNNFNLGVVSFVPFLTAPNPLAPKIPLTFTVVTSSGAVDQGQTSTLSMSGLFGGTTPYSYKWFEMPPGGSYTTVGTNSPNFNFVTLGSNLLPPVTATGSWKFILQVTDSVGAAMNSTALFLSFISGLRRLLEETMPRYLRIFRISALSPQTPLLQAVGASYFK